MPNVKKISTSWSETGKTVYAIGRREADGYLFNDADGAFAAAPADPYVSLPEHGTIKGLYEASESRTTWNDGRYSVIAYKQAGGAPAPASDTVIGAGTMHIINDAEAVGAYIALPVMQGSVYTATAAQQKVVAIVRGDTPRIIFDLGADYTGWTVWFGAKAALADALYAIAVKQVVWSDATKGQGYVDLTAAETATVRRLLAEIEIRNGAQTLTAVKFILDIKDDVIK